MVAASCIPPTSSEKRSRVAAISVARSRPGLLRRYQRASSSTIASTPSIRRDCTSGGDDAVQPLDVVPVIAGVGDVARDQEAAADLVRRAAGLAVIRCTNVMPIEFTTSLVTMVAISSRRSGRSGRVR